MKSLVIAFIFCFFLSGCQIKSAFLKPAYEDGQGKGEVFLYAQPFPQESDKIRFNVESVFAIKDDGVLFPLSLSLSDIKCRDMKRQRLIASGWLPPGHYTGFSFKIRNASLEVEDGEANLLVPEEPVMAEFIFDISMEKSYVFSLAFNDSLSIKSRFSFSPVFSIFLPKRPVTSLLGYVANHDSNNITVFDKKDMQVIGVITTGKKPSGIAFEQNLKRAYITLSGDDSVNVIDITSGELINSIKLNTGDKPQWPTLTRTGKLLITVNSGSDSISIIDPLDLIELSRIPVGNGPHSILIDPSGRRAYVFNNLSSTISVIDIASRSVVSTISTEPGPLLGQFNREGDKLYVIHEWSSNVIVIDPFSLSVLKRIRVGMGARALKLDIRANLLYVVKKDDTLVEVYDPFSFIPIDYIKAEGNASYITIDGEENNLYLLIPGMKSLIIVDIVSKKIVSKIDVGENPYWVTMMGER